MLSYNHYAYKEKRVYFTNVWSWRKVERGTLLQKITFYCFKLIAFYNRFYIDYNEQLKQYYQISSEAYLSGKVAGVEE